MEEDWSVGSCQPLAHRRRQQAFEPHDVYRLLGNLLCLVALVTKLFLVFLLLHNFEVFIEISRHSAILKKIKDIGIGETTTESRFPGTLSPKLEPGLLDSSFTASSVHRCRGARFKGFFYANLSNLSFSVQRRLDIPQSGEVLGFLSGVNMTESPGRWFNIFPPGDALYCGHDSISFILRWNSMNTWQPICSLPSGLNERWPIRWPRWTVTMAEGWRNQGRG